MWRAFSASMSACLKSLPECLEFPFRTRQSLEEGAEVDAVEGGAGHDLVEPLGRGDRLGHRMVVALAEPFRRELYLPLVVRHD